MKKKSRCAITLIGTGMPEVKVCDIIDGKPKVKRKETDKYIEFTLRYSLFHKEIKRYDKITFEELQ
ncbi:MAG: UDP-N-acetylmuramoyl-tripeptide--D-alanyl-D-alanine ligase [Lachnospiraceae bacterium]|nr:UDP-N-acetylmuramoyl-tripeptide--D-alanyl-D-alanine ligase [Lachnospiraceae bacterium]MDE6252925.1 UDP-N-acetylmuramoyl-tripeptide--D-alanyl-D-alanine ligase [Lachnospiraceae bacterium]